MREVEVLQYAVDIAMLGGRLCTVARGQYGITQVVASVRGLYIPPVVRASISSDVNEFAVTTKTQC